MSSPVRMVMVASALTVALGGCVPVVLGGATETAVVVAQERSVGNAVDDAGVFIAIKNKFAQQSNNNLFASVEVKVIEGRVLLTGNVDKPEDAVKAVDLTWQVEGVREVINEMQINDQSSFSNYARDVWISTQVRSRLLFTKGIRSVNYSVITVNGTVYLMGIAQDETEQKRAEQVARTTSYVKQVVSHVRQKTDPRRLNAAPQ